MKIKRLINYIVTALFGGNWNNGVNCSSRSSNWNNSPLNLNDNISRHATSETWGLTSRLNLLTCSLKRQTHNEDSSELVKFFESSEVFFI